MIYDAGFLGLFFPFELYFTNQGYLYSWAGDDFTEHSLNSVSLVSNDVGGDCIMCNTPGTVYYRTTDKVFSPGRFGNYSHFTAAVGGVRLVESSYMIIQRDNIQVRIANASIGAPYTWIKSRDSEMYLFTQGQVRLLIPSLGFGNLFSISESPGRLQKHSNNYYYSSGAHLKKIDGSIIISSTSFITDWYLGDTTLLLTLDGLYYYDVSYNLIGYILLQNLTESSYFSISREYIAISASGVIYIVKNMALAYEINTNHSSIAIISNE